MKSETGRQPSKDKDTLQEKFLSSFEGEQKKKAIEVLDLARSSYQLRDDDIFPGGKVGQQCPMCLGAVTAIYKDVLLATMAMVVAEHDDEPFGRSVQS